MELNISEIKVGKRFRKDMGDLDSLAASMDRLGLLQDILVTSDYELIAGQRRFKAAKKLGWQKIGAKVAKDLTEAVQLLEAERDENTCRKNLSVFEGLAAGDAIEKLLKPKMKEHQGRPGQPRSAKLAERANGEAQESREVGAAASGMSRGNYVKAKAVAEAAKTDPEKFGLIAEEMNRTGKVDPAYKKLKKLQNPPPPRPERKYPHSDTIAFWLEVVIGKAHVIDVDHGGIKALLSEEDKWDWNMVRKSILPQFDRVFKHLSIYRKEIGHALLERGKASVP